MTHSAWNGSGSAYIVLGCGSSFANQYVPAGCGYPGIGLILQTLRQWILLVDGESGVGVCGQSRLHFLGFPCAADARLDASLIRAMPTDSRK